MMALSRKMLEQEADELELLLPWHAAGTLSARDARRVEEALARDPALARQYEAIRAELQETIHLNESLGAPSSRAMHKLFAAIDAEPVRQPAAARRLASRIAGFFTGLSPRTLAWSAGLGALLLLLQAGLIGAIVIRNQGASYQTASLTMDEPATRAMRPAAAPPSARALVRFAPDARVSDVAALLDSYQASIVGGASGGMFKLQFNRPMSPDELAAVVNHLQQEKIVGLAVASP